MTNPLHIGPVRQKISAVESACSAALRGETVSIPSSPGRDLAVVPIVQMREKKIRLSIGEDRARLLHGLANIELQAMELAYRSLIEFPDLPPPFREELSELAVSESRHLTLCLDGIENLGFHWGDWPVHLALWTAVDKSDSILDRLVIVHRY